jgi:uncharacterized protein (DUF1697 family)
MERYVAFLRGVSPMNCKMAELKRCLEAAGFDGVKTVLSSGNVAFSARSQAVSTLERKVESALEKHLGRSFQTFVRPSSYLQQLVKRAPYGKFDLPAKAKHVVTFLRSAPKAKISLPIEQSQVFILKLERTEVFSAYVATDEGPVFMTMLEKTFGKEITTRTLETVRKCSVA